jgi:hypothetical protein
MQSASGSRSGNYAFWIDQLQQAVHTGMAALRQVEEHALPPALDRLMRELGERKESLTAEEHELLLALVGFTEQRSIEKLRSELALRQLRAFFPDEVEA